MTLLILTASLIDRVVLSDSRSGHSWWHDSLCWCDLWSLIYSALTATVSWCFWFIFFLLEITVLSLKDTLHTVYYSRSPERQGAWMSENWKRWVNQYGPERFGRLIFATIRKNVGTKELNQSWQISTLIFNSVSVVVTRRDRRRMKWAMRLCTTRQCAASTDDDSSEKNGSRCDAMLWHWWAGELAPASSVSRWYKHANVDRCQHHNITQSVTYSGTGFIFCLCHD